MYKFQKVFVEFGKNSYNFIQYFTIHCIHDVIFSSETIATEIVFATNAFTFHRKDYVIDNMKFMVSMT